MWSSSASQCNVIDTKRGTIFHISSLSFHTDSYSWLLWKKASWRHADTLDITMATNVDISILTTQNTCIQIHQLQNDMQTFISAKQIKAGLNVNKVFTKKCQQMHNLI